MRKNSKKFFIQIVAPFFPYPVQGGADLIIEDQIQGFLRMGFQVDFVFWKLRDNQFQHIQNFQKTLASEHLTRFSIQHITLTEPTQKQRVFNSLFSPWASPEFFYYPKNLPSIEKAPFNRNVDLQIFHYSFSYALLFRQTQNLKNKKSEKQQVVFFHNLESELSLLNAKKWKLSSFIHLLNFLKLKMHEAKIAQRVDEVWFVSPKDQQKIVSQNLRCVPPSFSPKLFQVRKDQFLNRLQKNSQFHFGIIGGMDFLPNHESLKWLVQKLAPVLAQKGFSGKILVAGKSPCPKLMKQSAAFGFFEFLGFVPNLESFWSQIVCSLVPDFTGIGVRMKLLESLASGIPVLATPMAVQKIAPHLRTLPALLISPDPVCWADWMIQVNFDSLRRQCESYAPMQMSAERIYSFL